jgi:hypothetical protein
MVPGGREPEGASGGVDLHRRREGEARLVGGAPREQRRAVRAEERAELRRVGRIAAAEGLCQRVDAPLRAEPVLGEDRGVELAAQRAGVGAAGLGGGRGEGRAQQQQGDEGAGGGHARSGLTGGW